MHQEDVANVLLSHGAEPSSTDGDNLDYFSTSLNRVNNSGRIVVEGIYLLGSYLLGSYLLPSYLTSVHQKPS
jgi:hypothetical protein